VLLTGAVVLATAACEQAPAESATVAATGQPVAQEPLSSAPPPIPADAVETPQFAPRQPAPQPVRQSLDVPPVEFDPPVLDFGTIMPNEAVSGEFTVYNIGEENLEIVEAKVSCQCTTVTRVNGVILEPGESLVVEAGIDSRVTTGVRRENIKFIFKDYAQFVQFNLTAQVTLPVRATPSIFNLAGGEKTGHVAVESLDGRPFNILSAHGAPPRYVDFDPDFDEPRSRYMLEWDLTGVPESEIPRWWIIETDHPACPILDSWIRHPVNLADFKDRKWFVKQRRINLGAVKTGESRLVEASIKNIQLGQSVHAVRSLSSQFDVALEHVGKVIGDELEFTIRIDVKSSVEGIINGVAEVIISNASHQIDIIGKVME
jgi:hypothetical protein